MSLKLLTAAALAAFTLPTATARSQIGLGLAAGLSVRRAISARSQSPATT